MNYRTPLKKLPKLGDIVCEMPNECDKNPVGKPTECVVTYVNKKHKWYEVEFTDLGFKECYKGV